MHPTILKALSVRQPFASLIAAGTKTIEVRSRPTRFRGDLLICASRHRPTLFSRFTGTRIPMFMKGPTISDRLPFPLGQALCIVRLAHCRPLTPDDVPAAGGRELLADFIDAHAAEPLYAWIFRDLRPLPPPGPFPVKGQLNFFTVTLPAGAAA